MLFSFYHSRPRRRNYRDGAGDAKARLRARVSMGSREGMGRSGAMFSLARSLTPLAIGNGDTESLLPAIQKQNRRARARRPKGKDLPRSSGPRFGEPPAAASRRARGLKSSYNNAGRSLPASN